MQSNKSFLAIAAAILAFSTQALAVDQLTVGTVGNYPPFNTLDASGQVGGFDIEIALALCAKLKAECTVITAASNDLVPALYSHQVDFIAASLPIVEPSADVDFTAPYYTDMLQFIALKEGDFRTDPVNLKDKTLGAQRGSQSATWLQNNLSGTSIRLYDTEQDAYSDLIAGRLDGLLADKYASYDWMKTDAGKNFEFKGKAVVENNHMGLATRKGDPLRDRLNGALQELVTDGSYKKINDKYFPFSIY